MYIYVFNIYFLYKILSLGIPFNMLRYPSLLAVKSWAAVLFFLRNGDKNA